MLDTANSLLKLTLLSRFKYTVYLSLPALFLILYDVVSHTPGVVITLYVHYLSLFAGTVPHFLRALFLILYNTLSHSLVTGMR